MADLKIPTLNKNSDKFFFKKKLTLSRKSKSKLLRECFLMLTFSIFIIYLNYLIPNKILIFKNFTTNMMGLMNIIVSSMNYVYQICLAIFIIFSFLFVLILLLGSFSRLLKIMKRKSKRFNFQ